MRVILLILTVSGLLYGAYVRDATTNTVYDDATSLTWQDDGNVSINPKNWSDAIDYCEALDFAGAQDWRLPNFNELYMIADRSTYNPAMHMDAASGFQNVISSYYWSSTTTASDSGHAWGVNFIFGNGDWNGKTDSYYVRCVRSGQIIVNSAPNNITIDGGDSDTVAENLPSGTNVGTLAANDPDNGDTHTFGLTCATPGSGDGSFSIDGSTLKTAAVFDYETLQSYQVCVKTTDNHGASYEKVLSINVTDDVSDNPVACGSDADCSADETCSNNVCIIPVPSAEINIKGVDGFPLASGTMSVSTASGTDFGSAEITTGSVTRTFSIENTGTADLTLGSITITGSTDYAISQPSSPLSAGNSITFDLVFNPSTIGEHNGTISIVNGDSDENPYTFVVSGVAYGDSDGVNEAGGVDFNDNGIDDRDEADVATTGSGASQTSVDVTQSGDGVTLSSTSQPDNGSMEVTLNDGTNIILPYGMVSFTVTGLAQGGDATIRLYYNRDESIAGYAKNVNGIWYDVGATVSHTATKTIVEFTITDGSTFDLDTQVNGEVQDPGGVYRAGANNTVAVPLFGLPGFALLAMLFGLGGFGFLRRRV